MFYIMSKLSFKGKLSTFADNVALANVGNNWEKLKQIVETNLQHITK